MQRKEKDGQPGWRSYGARVKCLGALDVLNRRLWPT
jgi:hypothetical protein